MDLKNFGSMFLSALEKDKGKFFFAKQRWAINFLSCILTMTVTIDSFPFRANYERIDVSS